MFVLCWLWWCVCWCVGFLVCVGSSVWIIVLRRWGWKCKFRLWWLWWMEIVLLFRLMRFIWRLVWCWVVWLWCWCWLVVSGVGVLVCGVCCGLCVVWVCCRLLCGMWVSFRLLVVVVWRMVELVIVGLWWWVVWCWWLLCWVNWLCCWRRCCFVLFWVLWIGDLKGVWLWLVLRLLWLVVVWLVWLVGLWVIWLWMVWWLYVVVICWLCWMCDIVWLLVWSCWVCCVWGLVVFVMRIIVWCFIVVWRWWMVLGWVIVCVGVVCWWVFGWRNVVSCLCGFVLMEKNGERINYVVCMC